MNPFEETSSTAREVNYEVTNGFATLLQRLGCTILVSTYQAGKLVVIRSVAGKLGLSFHNFQQAMGIAVGTDDITIGSKGVIWNLRSAPIVAKQMKERVGHDACYLARSARVCDDIHLHEIAQGRAGLWVVNTKFSCLCTLDDDYSFVPRWRPDFVSELAPEDRCHLNGLAMSDGLPAYVTVMGRTNTEKGWRVDKIHGGCVLDVTSQLPVVRQLSMPHSPRLYRGRLFVLDSGRGQFGLVDNLGANGRFVPICKLPGFTRGLAFIGPYAVVGLSKIRETSTFGGVPIGERSEDLKCAIAIIDLQTGKKVEHFEFVSGVDEIFDVQIIPNVSNPFIGGIHPESDNTPVIWAVPPLGAEPALSSTAIAPAEPQGIVVANSPVRQSSVSAQALQHFTKGLECLRKPDYQAAQDAFKLAIQDSPAMADAWCNLGVVKQLLDELDESVSNFRKAIELQPEMPAAHFNLAMTLLLQGKLDAGWEEYEWRWRCPQFGHKPAAIEAMAPAWESQSLADKSILVYGEQGIGDEVMFYSCLPELIELARQVYVSCEHRLAPIVRRSFPEAIVFEADRMAKDLWRERVGRIDFQIAVGSLPSKLRPCAESFPARESYLRADLALMEYWRTTLPNTRPRIGISWQGGLNQDQKYRSTNLDQWQPLLERFDATWVSLQYGNHQHELGDFTRRTGIAIHDPSRIDSLSELDDFFALIASLDLVISVDNSTVHFAGALGVATLAMVVFPSTSHWRWGRRGQRTAWYPSVQLIRKEPSDNWEQVIEEGSTTVRRWFLENR